MASERSVRDARACYRAIWADNSTHSDEYVVRAIAAALDAAVAEERAVTQPLVDAVERWHAQVDYSVDDGDELADVYAAFTALHAIRARGSR